MGLLQICGGASFSITLAVSRFSTLGWALGPLLNPSGSRPLSFRGFKYQKDGGTVTLTAEATEA
jgi:hypothetical protein